jgi:hypothetical protein
MLEGPEIAMEREQVLKGTLTVAKNRVRRGRIRTLSILAITRMAHWWNNFIEVFSLFKVSICDE